MARGRGKAKKRGRSSIDLVARHARVGYSLDPENGNEHTDSRIRVLQPDGSILTAGPVEIHGPAWEGDGAEGGLGRSRKNSTPWAGLLRTRSPRVIRPAGGQRPASEVRSYDPPLAEEGEDMYERSSAC